MSKTVSRKDLVGDIAKKVGTDIETATDAVDAIERIVIDAIGNGKCVKINGFGTFHLRHRKVISRGEVKPKKQGVREEHIISFRPSKSLVALDEA